MARGSGIKKVKLDFNQPGVKDKTVVDVFGKKPINPMEIAKAVWKFIKKYDVRVN